MATAWHGDLPPPGGRSERHLSSDLMPVGQATAATFGYELDMDPTVYGTGPKDDRDTRGALLRAATFVFADRGFDAATLREVTKAAGANIAAVNYHFRSKDELLRLTLEHCLGPLNTARLEAIEACEQCPNPSLRLVLNAIIAPLVELSLDERGGRATIRLMLQTKALPRNLTNEIFATQFDELHRRSRAMLQRVAPHLDEIQIALRYEYIRGATLQIVADLDPNARRMPGLERIQGRISDRALVDDIVHFCATGFSHPPF